MAGRLHDRFVSLCETPSPTGSEREVADLVLGELRELGWEVEEDASAAAARAGAGNLIARLPGQRDRWVLFCAHLDTVPHRSPVRVELVDGIYRSAGETILGADNKAAVAVLLELAARAIRSAPAAGIELVFTVAEEEGLRGAKQLDLAGLRSGVGFVLDHASEVGEVITAAPTYQRLIATFTGIEAHAGVEPESGRSAIAAAARAISAMSLGRLDEETTANIGLIQGGTAANVVPGRCVVEGEVRSLEATKVAARIGEMVDACSWAAGEQGADLDVEVIEMFRGFRVDGASAALRIARDALRRCGIEPLERATGGGSDANALRAAGFDALLLANGTFANHTPGENVPAANLERMLAICEAVVAVVGEDEPDQARPDEPREVI